MKVILVIVFLAFNVQTIANEFTTDNTVYFENTTLQNETNTLKTCATKEDPACENVQNAVRISAISISLLILALVTIGVILIYVPHYKKNRYRVTKTEALEMAVVKPETADVGVGTNLDCDCHESFCGRCTINLLAEARKCYERELPRRPFIYS